MRRIHTTLVLSVALLSAFLTTRSQAFTVLGVGDAALMGDDLTDRGDDGDEAAYAPTNSFGNFDAEFSASDRPGFNADGVGDKELAFNVFDNLTGGGQNKWCCGPSSNSVTARILAGPHVLTAFTITSSNDTPARDPRVWEIQGSNDGINFTPIYRQENPSSAVWGNTRNQVIRFSPADGDSFLVSNQAFTTFRMNTFSTGGGNFALGEIEFFGIPNLPPEISDLDGDELSYLPLSGALTIDQGAAAQVTDPLQGTNEWETGMLNVEIISGGEVAEDVLSIAGGTTLGAFGGGTNGIPLQVAFNPGVTTPQVAALIQSIQYENLLANPTPATRVVHFTLSDGDGGVSEVAAVTLRMDVGGVVTSYVWDGGGDGSSFTNAANWVGDSGVPDANDIAIFRTDTGTGNGTVNLGGTVFVGEVVFDGNGNYTLGGGALATDAIHQQSTATGTNAITASILSGSLAGLVENGVLSPSNSANGSTLLGGNWTVRSGGTLEKTGGGSLGATELILDGGRLTLVADTGPVSGRFVQIINNGSTFRALHLGEVEVFQPGVVPAVDNAAGSGTLNPGIDLATTSSGAILFDKGALGGGFVNDHGGNDDGRLIDGAENIAGDVFGIQGNQAFVTVDLGSIQSIGSIRLHQRNDGCCQNRLMDVTVNIFDDNGGAPGTVIASMPYPAQPLNNSFAEVSAQLGNTILNEVVLQSASVIEIRPGAPANFGDLDVPAASTLDVIAPAGGDLIFSGATTLDDTLSLTQTGMPLVVMNDVNGPGGLVLDGDGSLRLPTENTYEGVTTVNNGVLIADTGLSLGGTTQGTVIRDGGGLQISNGTFNEFLTLNGMGNAKIDGALNKQPAANAFWVAPITISSSSRIYSAGEVLFIDGDVNLSFGSELTVEAQNQVQFRVNDISGGANTRLRFEGNDRTFLFASNPSFLGDIEVINDGRLDVAADGALGDGAGTTSILGGESTLVLRNGHTQVEDIICEGDGRGTEGAIRNENNNNTLRGTITLLGDTEFVTRIGSSLTIDGTIIGGNPLIQRETGTLILTQDNDLSNFDLVGGGTTRMQTTGGLGSTPVFTVDAGETLEFEGNLLFDGLGALTQLNANDGTISSFSGTSQLDIPILASPDLPIRFGGAGDLVILQPLGNGAGAPTNDLVKTGGGHTILTTTNTYNGDTFVLEGTIETAVNGALGIPGNNLVVEDSGTLALNGGLNYAFDQVLLDGIGAADQLGAIVSSGGDNTITANAINALPISLGEVRLVSTNGLLTLNGPVDLVFSGLSTDGAGDIAITGDISGSGSIAGDFIPNARFVQVQKNIPGLLHIGELEVFIPGTGPDNDNMGGNNAPLNNTNDLALASAGATVFSASTVGGHGDPNAVIDGLEQTAGTTWTKQQDAGETTAQITIDLGASFDIGTVRVHQRNEACCQERLQNFTVHVYADAGGTPGALVASEVFPGRPPQALFGELSFPKITDNRFDKRGTGTVTLSGSNTYLHGSTAIDGPLLVMGNPASGGGAVSVFSGATLGGTGTISGSVFVGIQGVINPGTSPGTLNLNSNLTFTGVSSVYRAEIDNATLPGIDRLSISGDLALDNATLDLQRDPGYTPLVNDTLVIADYGGNLTGTFNTLSEGGAVSAQGSEFIISYLAGQITLTATGNSRVYAGPDSISRTATNPVTVAASVLLANDLIGAGAGPLAVLSVSPTGVNGGSITLTNNLVSYTPPASFAGNDSFTYTVSDGTDSAAGLVTVIATAAPDGDPAIGEIGNLEVLGDGSYRAAFSGTPGSTYQVQWTQDLVTPPVTWNDLGSVTVDTSGAILVDHPNPPDGIVYYRAVLVD